MTILIILSLRHYSNCPRVVKTALSSFDEVAMGQDKASQRTKMNRQNSRYFALGRLTTSRGWQCDARDLTNSQLCSEGRYFGLSKSFARSVPITMASATPVRPSL